MCRSLCRATYVELIGFEVRSLHRLELQMLTGLDYHMEATTQVVET